VADNEHSEWPGYQPAQPQPEYRRYRSLGLRLIVLALCLLLVWAVWEFAGAVGLRSNRPEDQGHLQQRARTLKKGLLRHWAETWGLVPETPPPPPPEVFREYPAPEYIAPPPPGLPERKTTPRRSRHQTRP